jgi:hypothetical protein
MAASKTRVNALMVAGIHLADDSVMPGLVPGIHVLLAALE